MSDKLEFILYFKTNAETDMDLIVMGNSIRNLIFKHLLGDTVLNVIQQSDRPLFLAQ